MLQCVALSAGCELQMLRIIGTSWTRCTLQCKLGQVHTGCFNALHTTNATHYWYKLHNAKPHKKCKCTLYWVKCTHGRQRYNVILITIQYDAIRWNVMESNTMQRMGEQRYNVMSQYNATKRNTSQYYAIHRIQHNAMLYNATYGPGAQRVTIYCNSQYNATQYNAT